MARVRRPAVAPLLRSTPHEQDIALFGGTVDIKVGIQHVTREVVVDSADSAKDVEKAFTEALASDDGFLRLNDAHGRKVLIPAGKIAYIDIGEENARRVGFGTL
jgi:hypothetical protein